MSASPAAGRRQRKSQQLPARRCTEQTAPGLSPPGVLLPPGSGRGLQASLFLAHFGLKAKQKLVKYAVLTALEKKKSLFVCSTGSREGCEEAKQLQAAELQGNSPSYSGSVCPALHGFRWWQERVFSTLGEGLTQPGGARHAAGLGSLRGSS